MNQASLERQRDGIAERIALVRGPRSQRAFARDMAVPQQNVNRYENGTVPHVDFLIQIAAAERVNLNWLLTGKGVRRRSRR